ncbi:MAG: 1-acyl-sn-glycerol-3-phosphate acyltransferase [Deltaproteobacteria bacterium]|nr:1-acyl-sn-glycerol-3-phosphate acyltransferase [Deltaproteobacteria bacterium]
MTESIPERVKRIELPWNRHGYDPYGISRRHLVVFYRFLAMLRRYFDVRVHGIENVPARGGAMLVGNHSGGVALDGAMVIASTFFDMDPPRLAQGMAEKFLNLVPFAAQWSYRTGNFTGLPEHATKLLGDGRLLMVFPEGARGTAKLYPERYSLVEFGTGFMRLALSSRVPIVPFAFLGGGEAIPTVYNAKTLGKLVGAPYVPFTPYVFPVPLPVRLDLFYGEPMRFEGTGDEDDEHVHGFVTEVKTRIASMLETGRALRKEGR